MIKLNNISFMRGTKTLLEPSSLDIFPGQKCAIIGANGCGKSSLFALLQQQLTLETGSYHIPKEWRMVAVAQHTPNTDEPALDYVISGDKHLMTLQSQLATAEQQEKGELIGQLHAQLQDAGAYDVQARAATILAGLGFNNEALTRSVSDFSGGWRMRLNLAQALLCPSDILLLDEPTNHLDLDAVIWLEKWLQKYPGTLLLISHDKSFIDAIAQHVLSFESAKLLHYKGNYTSYQRQRSERLRLQQLEYTKQQAKTAHLQSFIDRFKAKASKAKQAQSRIKQLEKMQEIAPVHAQSAFSFEFLPPAKLPNPLVAMEKVKIGYGDNVILHEVKLNLVPGSRIGLLGRNGAGKSTLIKLLAQAHQPMSGEYTTSQGLDIGYFAQHQVDTLDMVGSPLSHLQHIDRAATEQALRDYLGGFGFHGDEATSIVKPMSGGEKARLALALIVYRKPNLLLLDEPTNHLDLEMRDALNFALQGFTGAMVLVSHDRTLLASVCEDFYLVDAGEVAVFSGDLDDYTQWVLNETKKERQADNAKQSAPNEANSSNTTAVDRKTQKRLEAEFRKATAALRKQIIQSEQAMERAQAKLTQIEAALSDPSVYEDSQKAQLKTLLSDQASTTQAHDNAEETWCEAQEALEEAQTEFDEQFA
ncbi:MAG: ATP-binding cassette domain-containing protein [Glaciecola sp.]